MDNLKDILGKKKKEKPGDDIKKEAKLGVLKDLRGMASSMMKDGMKAVVMAKDKKGLEEGLSKAKDVVKDIPEREDDEDSVIEEMEEESGRDLDNDDEEGESPEHQIKVLAEECDPEDIDKLIAALEAKKREKMMEG